MRTSGLLHGAWAGVAFFGWEQPWADGRASGTGRVAIFGPAEPRPPCHRAPGIFCEPRHLGHQLVRTLGAANQPDGPEAPRLLAAESGVVAGTQHRLMAQPGTHPLPARRSWHLQWGRRSADHRRTVIPRDPNGYAQLTLVRARHRALPGSAQRPCRCERTGKSTPGGPRSHASGPHGGWPCRFANGTVLRIGFGRGVQARRHISTVQDRPV